MSEGEALAAVRLLEVQMVALEARVGELDRDMAELKSDMRTQLEQIRTEMTAGHETLRGAVETVTTKLEAQESWVRNFYQDRDGWPTVDRTASRVEAMDVRLQSLEKELRTMAQTQADRSDKILDALRDLKAPKRAPVWESPDGRRMVYVVAATAVVCALALGGVLTPEQVMSTIGAWLGFGGE